jgi:putative hemolysin
VVVLAGCVQSNTLPCKGKAGCANPASSYCFEQNQTLQIREDPLGGQYGVCVFGDGSECDEWRFYRGECKPGQSFITAPPRVQEYCQNFKEVYLCKQGVVKKVGAEDLRFITGRGSEVICQKGPEQMNALCNDLVVEGFCDNKTVCS